MENRIGSSDGAEIPKKSRSLDLKSIYNSKVSKESRSKNLKRKASVEDGDNDNEKIIKKKKSKKSVSLSNLKNVDTNSSKSLDEVYNGGLSSGSHDSKDSKSGLSRQLNNGRGLSSILLSFDDSGVQIPRRKRDFVGRSKFESSQVSKPAGESSSKMGLGDQVGKVSGDDLGGKAESSKVKRKKGFDDFKESRNSKSNSAQRLKEEDGHASQPVVNNGVSSLKKSRRRDRKKKKDLAPDSKSVAKEAEPLVDSSVQNCDDLQEDDEENLEENAARMLSSRFDPSCTGFSSNSKASASSSTNGLSFLFSGRHFVTRGSKPLSGSESASVDTDGRVLRPRNQHKEKGSSRKRRHYYEIFDGDLDAYWVLNKRIKVFWPLDQSWYYGLVNDYDEERKLHHVKYDDRDEEWINLQHERFKLLLLPSEVPGKAERRRSRIRNRRSDEGKGKGNLKPGKEKEERDLTTEDDSYMGSYMDSEPIISWLARSTRRVKSSPFHAKKKQKISGLSPTSMSPLSDEACLDGGYLKRDKSKLSSNSALPVKLADAGRCEESALETPTCPSNSKPPIVYVRKRFRKTGKSLCYTSEADNVSRGEPESVTSFAPVGDVFVDLEKHENSLGNLVSDGALWSTDNAGFLKLTIPLIESRQFRFELSFPVLSVLKYSFGAENCWLFRAVMLLRYGTVMTVWPRVHLEMLFVDNIVGLRFLLFEGCLKQAVALVILVLTIFHQPDEQWKYADLQLPVTSIKFKFSCIQDFRKQLVFACYNFSAVKSSKWSYLQSKLEGHCSFTRQLPLSECTYDNINAFQNGTNKLPSSSICRDSSLTKGLQRRSRQGISRMGVCRESTCVKVSQFSSNSDKKHINLPPFALSFTAAPTFFLGLHLKLLMQHSVAHISFRDHNSIEHLDNSCSFMADGCSRMEDCACKGSVGTLENGLKASAGDAARFSCAKSELGTVGLSVCSDGSWVKSSQKYQNGELNVAGTSASSQDPDEIGTESIVPLQRRQGHDSELEQCVSSPKPLVDRDKIDSESHALLKGITVEIPPFDQFEKHANRELNGAQQSTDLSWNMNGGIIPSPNPTAPRSTWHRNKNNSSSFGSFGHGWSDGKSDFFHNNFGNGPKKPRTQVSYTLPYGGFDCSPKNKSHYQKGLPNKRIRRANEKRLSDVSRGSQRNLELLSCDANVLITLGDRGWRESGAQIVLELFDPNEWKLAIKLSGTTRYSYKAHQFLQPGSTNRYTHAMMWKGGKDWSLEFPDRSQWAIFKEMHEECYNRNIRAALVKNIPIPGVRLMEENDDIGAELAFVRSSSKYFRQVETDVEMALDPLRVLYDMDSDDEKWILKTCNSSEVDKNSSWEISDEMFEKTMDMFEKAAYAQQRDQFTSDEIEEIMAGVVPMEVIKNIYEHWQQKRQKKGMPLIRHLQPPLWEGYQKLVKEWELAMSKIPNGCQEKPAPIEKPAMFAFCLKPRGLEVPNRGSKQRSQKKFSVSGQSNAILDHDGFHTPGRRLNGFAYGDEKVVYPGHNYELFDDSPLPQTSPRVFTQRDAGGMGHFSMSNDGFERNHLLKLQRSNSKKIGTFLPSHDAQMVALYNQKLMGKRNGIHRWNMGFSESPNQRHYQSDGSHRHGPEPLDGSDLDEFKLRDASGAAQRALNMAKLKREKAQRLHYRADLAIHKAVVALMTAEAIKASSGDLNGDG